MVRLRNDGHLVPTHTNTHARIHSSDPSMSHIAWWSNRFALQQQQICSHAECALTKRARDAIALTCVRTHVQVMCVYVFDIVL